MKWRGRNDREERKNRAIKKICVARVHTRRDDAVAFFCQHTANRARRSKMLSCYNVYALTNRYFRYDDKANYFLDPCNKTQPSPPLLRKKKVTKCARPSARPPVRPPARLFYHQNRIIARRRWRCLA